MINKTRKNIAVRPRIAKMIFFSEDRCIKKPATRDPLMEAMVRAAATAGIKANLQEEMVTVTIVSTASAIKTPHKFGHACGSPRDFSP